MQYQICSVLIISTVILNILWCALCPLQATEGEDVMPAVDVKQEEGNKPSCSSVHLGGWSDTLDGEYCQLPFWSVLLYITHYFGLDFHSKIPDSKNQWSHFTTGTRSPTEFIITAAADATIAQQRYDNSNNRLYLADRWSENTGSQIQKGCCDPYKTHNARIMNYTALLLHFFLSRCSQWIGR